MKIALVVFFPGQKMGPLGEKIVSRLKNAGHDVSVIQVQATKFAPSKKLFDFNPNPDALRLVSTKTDLSSFDLVLLGTNVIGMMPKRKLPPEMELFLADCTGLEGKKTAVFLSAFGLAGTVPKKLASILATRKASLVETRVFTFLINFSPQQFKEAGEFADRIAQA